MIRLYLSETGRHSCVGSEKRSEVLEFLEGAGVRASHKMLRQTCGYWWIQVKGDRHFQVMKSAHGGIPRLTYRDLTLLSLNLLGKHLGDLRRSPRIPQLRRAQ